MKSDRIPHYNMLKISLNNYEAKNGVLDSLADPQRKEALLQQMVDSIRRIEFINFIRDQNRPIDPVRYDPNSTAFDPLRAAVHYKRAGNVDEACWLVFLATHFGKNKTSSWNLTRAVYGGLGTSTWNWKNINDDLASFLNWLDLHQAELKEIGSFSNHRKYESLNAYGSRGTGAAISSYMKLINSYGGHTALFKAAQLEVGNDPKVLFDNLYEKLSAVITFGRVGKFDYLTMIGKLLIVKIEPGIAYLKNATGPLRGSRLLFGNDVNAALNAKALEVKIASFAEEFLDVHFIMQVLEDSLCNWQKNPEVHIYFRG